MGCGASSYGEPPAVWIVGDKSEAASPIKGVLNVTEEKKKQRQAYLQKVRKSRSPQVKPKTQLRQRLSSTPTQEQSKYKEANLGKFILQFPIIQQSYQLLLEGFNKKCKNRQKKEIIYAELVLVLKDMDSSWVLDSTELEALVSSACGGTIPGQFDFKRFLQSAALVVFRRTIKSDQKGVSKKFTTIQTGIKAIEAAFSSFDLNGDGVVELEEIKDLVNKGY